MECVVELKNATKIYKGFSIDKMNLQIRKGYITGLIGANGAGKSTTIKMMMNLIKPEAGEVKVFGQDYSTHEKAIKERIGFVYDGNVFYEGMNLTDIRRIVGPAYKHWDNRLFHEYVERFELPLKKSVKTFSKGMQMKASLAIALSHDAELIIMDEPTAGLDPVFRRELLDLLQELMLDGKRTILFSTHITTDLERIADYIAFINKGELIFNQTAPEVEESYALVKGGTDLLDRDTEKSFVHVNRASTGFEALTDNVNAVRETFGESVVIERATLEDIMYYTKGSKSYA
ncbi:ABC transporter ATP-binding protein [Jeotgalibacillus malaysiensis]|uniref:ABC transporter ATP-binding protein n=1 Tax=Jeotgalibacillus malaysiensis TaxID=1508404 RepID=UPI003850BCCB